MNAVQARQIGKSYGHFQVLEDVSFELEAGECFALFGPNGAGKTTLLRILATLTRPSAGQFHILGHDGVREKDTIRSSVLFIAHSSHLYEDLTAIENLKFATALKNGVPPDQQIKRTLDHVVIGPFGDLKVRYFSAGMKKRLVLAKAMLLRPKVLLLDEPFTSLDLAGTAIMKRYLQDFLADGGAIFMTTHDRVHALELAQKAGVLKSGLLRHVAINDLKGDDFLY